MSLHSISKITLRSRDFARTERFYRELFGWKFHQYSETYLGFEPPSGIDGGFQRRDDFVQGDSYLLYISWTISLLTCGVFRNLEGGAAKKLRSCRIQWLMCAFMIPMGID